MPRKARIKSQQHIYHAILLGINKQQIFYEESDFRNFEKEIKKNKPVILALHVPIEPVTGDKALIQKCDEIYGKNASKKYQLIMGQNGRVPNHITQKFIDLALSEDSPVIMVLAGHLHFYHRDMLNDKIVQIVTGPAYSGEALKITVK